MIAFTVASASMLMSPVALQPSQPSLARTGAPQMATPAWARPALSAALAAAITLAPMDAAFAASRSGGRVGGRVSTSAPAKAPSSTPSTTSSTARTAPTATAASSQPQVTNVIVQQPMGYGYGGGYGMGGNGLGMYMGLSIAEAFLREQQRQAYLQQQLKVQQQLGADQAKIAELQAQLTAQNEKVNALAAQKDAAPNAPAQQMAAPGEDQLRLQLQVLQQQKELEMLRQGKAEVAVAK